MGLLDQHRIPIWDTFVLPGLAYGPKEMVNTQLCIRIVSVPGCIDGSFWEHPIDPFVFLIDNIFWPKFEFL